MEALKFTNAWCYYVVDTAFLLVFRRELADVEFFSKGLLHDLSHLFLMRKLERPDVFTGFFQECMLVESGVQELLLRMDSLRASIELDQKLRDL